MVWVNITSGVKAIQWSVGLDSRGCPKVGCCTGWLVSERFARRFPVLKARSHSATGCGLLKLSVVCAGERVRMQQVLTA